MHAPDLVFNEISLKEGNNILDLGCGPGDYSIEASRTVGSSGAVYALDKWQYLLDDLIKEADAQGLKNIRAMVSDITGTLPVEAGCIDICLLFTVLHIFDLSKVEKTIFNEIRRVLKPCGRLAIIECKKEEQPFGPPKHMRLSPEDIEDSIQQYGFRRLGLTDLGYNYMIQFAVN
jgi:ubiquinone/menaquinone biosynthesis C-methylase UbiE